MRWPALIFVTAAAPTTAQDLVYDFSDTIQCLAAGDASLARMECVGSAATACMDRTEAEDADLAGEIYAPPSQAEALRKMGCARIGFRDSLSEYGASRWTGGSGASPASIAYLMHTAVQQVIFLEEAVG
ncbi:hypothetical protein [Roseovarius sp.]|uniref:hypothetical protein n=1 Tax=Roseovarius sp. TaxID=1486281 RepID=UPI002611BF3B|nr:hypothetical protein [Roseovarius sp.]